MNLKLSICVPTFNRADLLQEALEAIAGQGDAALFQSVEVLVSDNASADNTLNVVQAIQARYSYLTLRYMRHAENIGMDRNLYGVVSRAAGEFVLVVSDDDVLLPGAVAKLLSVIEAQPDLGAICLNMKTFQSDPSQEAPAILTVSKDRMLPDRDACLRLFGTWITFLSIVAFRRSLLRPEGYESRIGTYFVLSYLFLDVLGRGALVLQQPLLAVRDNYSGGYNFFEVFVTQFGEMMAHAVQQSGYSPRVVQRVLRRHLRLFLFPFLLAYKGRASAGRPRMNYREGAQRLLRAYGPDPFLLFVMLPLLFTPPVLLRAAVKCRRLFKALSVKAVSVKALSVKALKP